jgi:hypothetical protein
MPMGDPNMSMINYFYQSTMATVKVIDETLLYDFTDIVSAVGGNLGLFLGFSFFSCGSYFLDKISICKCLFINYASTCENNTKYLFAINQNY